MNTITLTEMQSIENVAQLREDILGMLDRDGPLRVDASAVVQVDTATLQLLAALVRTAAATNRPARIDRPSPEFSRAAERLGLSGLFGLGG